MSNWSPFGIFYFYSASFHSSGGPDINVVRPATRYAIYVQSGSVMLGIYTSVSVVTSESVQSNRDSVT